MTSTSNKLIELLNTDVSKLFAPSESLGAKSTVRALNQRVNRKSERFHPPFGTSKLDGQLLEELGMDYSITVWDLSEGGACLKVTKDPRPLLNRRVKLEVNNTGHTTTFGVDVVVRWIDPIAPNLYFAGVGFDCNPIVIRDSFLSTYLSESRG